MTDASRTDVRRGLLAALLAKVENDTYPSETMLDTVESLLGAEDMPAYAETLLTKIHADPYPSVSMIRRVQKLV